MATAELMERHFAKMGARVKIRFSPTIRVRDRRTHKIVKSEESFALDVKTDKAGEIFDVRMPRACDVQVVNIDPADRHLLLLVANPDGARSKFLCGHDERHWFVAAIPESAPGVINVATAKAALQPSEIQQSVKGLRAKERLTRRNSAYKRQGEWFFVPAPELNPDPNLILRNEPLRRGRGKIHMMEVAYREGGTSVYVSRKHPNGLTEAEYAALPEQERLSPGWSRMVRDAKVYCRGRVSHADHATLVLDGWHQVLMNTENKAAAMAHVAFLD